MAISQITVAKIDKYCKEIGEKHLCRNIGIKPNTLRKWRENGEVPMDKQHAINLLWKGEGR